MRSLVAGIQIDASPADVFAFFEHMNERRYRAWHPEAHRDFRYVRGDHVETGTVAHVEEVLNGDEHSYDVEYTAVVPDHVIEFRLTHSIWRVLLPKVRLEFRDSGGGSHFVQKLFLRSGPLSERSERIQQALAAVERHMHEECAYLKDILESDRTIAIDAGDDPVVVAGSSPQQVNVQTS